MAPGAIYQPNASRYGGQMVTRNLQIPPQIKCNRCYRVKNKDAFSTRQHQFLLDHMKQRPNFEPTTATIIPCIGCSAKQVVELKCWDCNSTKAVTAFNKVQRKAHKPICEVCTEIKRNYEPGSDVSGSGSDAEDSDSDDEFRSGGGTLDDDAATTTFNNESSASRGAGTYLNSTTGSTGSTGGVRLSATNSAPYSTTGSTSTARPDSGSIVSTARSGKATMTDIPARKQWAKPPKAKPAKNNDEALAHATKYAEISDSSSGEED